MNSELADGKISLTCLQVALQIHTSYFCLFMYTIQMATNHFTAYLEKTSPAHPQHLQAKYISLYKSAILTIIVNGEQEK